MPVHESKYAARTTKPSPGADAAEEQIMRKTPNYIVKSGIAGAPIDFKWGHPSAHIGPYEGTALHDAVYRLTHCAAVTLAAGLEEWSVVRFQGMVDTALYLAQAEGILTWAIDPRYYKGPSALENVESPPAESAMSVLADLACNATRKTYRKYPCIFPHTQVHQAFLLRYVIPKAGRKAFDGWMTLVLKRLAEVAARPENPIGDFESYENQEAYDLAQRPYRGVPIPLEALDPEFDYQPAMREELLDHHLRSLDWEHNEFLRSPDEMKALGFEGTPYRLR
jgi:hypothetical protein